MSQNTSSVILKPHHIDASENWHQRIFRQIRADSAVSTCIASEITSLSTAGSCLHISCFSPNTFQDRGSVKSRCNTCVMPSGSAICLPSLTPLPLLRTVPLIQVFSECYSHTHTQFMQLAQETNTTKINEKQKFKQTNITTN